MAGYLSDANHANRSRFEDTQSYNETVMSQVRALSDEVGSASELGVLQALVNARLERVAEHVGNFRARESVRLLEVNGSAERMRSRIAELELEATELHSKLDCEKQSARVDALTGIANRKSFEERIAQDIARKPGAEPRVVMLLWDLDNFKVINDSYGHRAGDLVLRSVAACFLAAVRGNDFVARIGGEEFVMLLGGTKNRASPAHCQPSAFRRGGLALPFPGNAGTRDGIVRPGRIEGARWRVNGVRPRGFCAVPRQAGRQEFMRRGLGDQARPLLLS